MSDQRSAVNEVAMRPWGVSRMAAYPTIKQLDYSITEIDPVTQVGIARDSGGKIVPIAAEETRHRTRNATNLDGQKDDDHLDDRR